MDKEIEVLEQNSTWDLIKLPTGKRAIGSKWVYNVKLNQDGSIERYKARLVAKGYTQIEGIDFFDSFYPVAKTVTVTKARNGLVCRLKWSLYGLKQASKQWNMEFTSKLDAFGFKQSSHDHYLFTMHTDSSFLALIVYVDDFLLKSDSLAHLSSVKQYLDDLFTIKDLGQAKFFLGLELARSAHGTFITQRKYLLDIVHACRLDDAKLTTTPLPAGIKFDASTDPVLISPERY
ncbi:UNVERIFIED_CONTAM: Copia protein [Sesamum radiatum]|uniref:Copia protein n=1 Tax=Sesamum radiatum TaxID=300843 RepID=A0AAW2JYU9_SESRA